MPAKNLARKNEISLNRKHINKQTKKPKKSGNHNLANGSHLNVCRAGPPPSGPVVHHFTPFFQKTKQIHSHTPQQHIRKKLRQQSQRLPCSPAPCNNPPAHPAPSRAAPSRFHPTPARPHRPAPSSPASPPPNSQTWRRRRLWGQQGPEVGHEMTWWGLPYLSPIPPSERAAARHLRHSATSRRIRQWEELVTSDPAPPPHVARGRSTSGT